MSLPIYKKGDITASRPYNNTPVTEFLSFTALCGHRCRSHRESAVSDHLFTCIGSGKVKKVEDIYKGVQFDIESVIGYTRLKCDVFCVEEIFTQYHSRIS